MYASSLVNPRQVCRPAEKTAGKKPKRHNFVYIYAN